MKLFFIFVWRSFLIWLLAICLGFLPSLFVTFVHFFSDSSLNGMFVLIGVLILSSTGSLPLIPLLILTFYIVLNKEFSTLKSRIIVVAVAVTSAFFLVMLSSLCFICNDLNHSIQVVSFFLVYALIYMISSGISVWIVTQK